MSLRRVLIRLWNGPTGRDNKTVAAALDALLALFRELEGDPEDREIARRAASLLSGYYARHLNQSFSDAFASDVSRGVLDWRWSERNHQRVTTACEQATQTIKSEAG
jgi:hypothetical protein